MNEPDFTWLICALSKLSFWYEPWCNSATVSSYVDHIPNNLLFKENFTVGQCIHNEEWCLPEEFCQELPEVAEMINQVDIAGSDKDELVWAGSDDGKLIMKLAWNHYRDKGRKITWLKGLWRGFIPPTQSVHACKILRNRVGTASSLHARGMRVGTV